MAAARDEAPPLRWVSPAERAWDDQAVWRAFLDLLQHEPFERLGPEQRDARRVFELDRALHANDVAAFIAAQSRDELANLVAALRKLAAPAHADALEALLARTSDPANAHSALANAAPTLEHALRRYLDAYEPYFVRVARPSCT